MVSFSIRESCCWAPPLTGIVNNRTLSEPSDSLVNLLRLVISQLDNLHQEAPDATITIHKAFNAPYVQLLLLYARTQGYKIQMNGAVSSEFKTKLLEPLTDNYIQAFRNFLNQHAKTLGFKDVTAAQNLKPLPT